MFELPPDSKIPVCKKGHTISISALECNGTCECKENYIFEKHIPRYDIYYEKEKYVKVTGKNILYFPLKYACYQRIYELLSYKGISKIKKNKSGFDFGSDIDISKFINIQLQQFLDICYIDYTDMKSPENLVKLLIAIIINGFVCIKMCPSIKRFFNVFIKSNFGKFPTTHRSLDLSKLNLFYLDKFKTKDEILNFYWLLFHWKDENIDKIKDIKIDNDLLMTNLLLKNSKALMIYLKHVKGNPFEYPTIQWYCQTNSDFVSELENDKIESETKSKCYICLSSCDGYCPMVTPCLTCKQPVHAICFKRFITQSSNPKKCTICKNTYTNLINTNFPYNDVYEYSIEGNFTKTFYRPANVYKLYFAMSTNTIKRVEEIVKEEPEENIRAYLVVVYNVLMERESLDLSNGLIKLLSLGVINIDLKFPERYQKFVDNYKKISRALILSGHSELILEIIRGQEIRLPDEFLLKFDAKKYNIEVTNTFLKINKIEIPLLLIRFWINKFHDFDKVYEYTTTDYEYKCIP
jgi:hypothetical protein